MPGTPFLASVGAWNQRGGEMMTLLAHDLTSHDPLAVTRTGGTFTVTGGAASPGGTVPGFDVLATLGALGIIGALFLAGGGRRG